jgi:hypothetical protein
VVFGFTESAEYVAKSDTRIGVALDYVGLLGRTPEKGGFDNWVQQQEQGANEITVIGRFMASTEYHNRFLPEIS